MTLQLCRICGNKEGLLDIFKQGSMLLEKLAKCGYGNIKPGDFLPPYICQQCNHMLDLSHQLRSQNDIDVKDNTIQSVDMKQLEVTEVHLISDEDENSKNDFDLKIENQKIFQKDLELEEKNQSDVEEFAALEPTIFESKTESTILASETEDADELETNTKDSLVPNNVQGPVSFRSVSVDDIDSTESCDLSINSQIRASKLEAKEEETVDIGEAHDEFIPINVINKYPIQSLTDSNVNDPKSPHHPYPVIAHEDFEMDSRSSSVMPFMCPLCNASYSTRSDYYDHVQQHGYTNYQCPTCSVNFQTRYEFACHEATHIVNGTYDCHYCMRKYYASYLLLRHIRSCHSNEEKFCCDICQVSYTRLTGLKRHVQHVHSNKKWHCKSCGESFRSAYFLNNHKYKTQCSQDESARIKPRPNNTLPPEYIIKVSDNRYKCIHCNALFKTLYTYKNHLLIHEDVRPFQCSTCPKAFRTRYAMVTHERIHTNEKPFKCDICSKVFRQVTHLKHHRYQHMKADMPFKCSICQVGCITKWKLREHLRRHFTEKAFKCAECPEGFFLKYDLKKHARQVHKRSVVFADSDNEGNQTNLLDFTEGTTETDKTDDEVRNRNSTDIGDEVIDIADDEEDEEEEEEGECYTETSNSFQGNVLIPNEAQVNSLQRKTEDTNMSLNSPKIGQQLVQQPLITPNKSLETEKANESSEQYIIFNEEELQSNEIPPQEKNTKTISNEKETIVDFIDLEEDEEPELLVPLEKENEDKVPSKEEEEIINLDDDEEEDENELEKQKNISSTNQESLPKSLPNNGDNSQILKTLLFKNTDESKDSFVKSPEPRVANEFINDYIHLDSSNSCQSPPMSHQEEEYYDNVIGDEPDAEKQEQGEYETIIEEKIEITEQKIETFSSFYQFGDMAKS